MRYALCLRGISYLEKYTFDNRGNMDEYTIDFIHSVESIEKNILNPLREQGHTVDVFFNTYSSIKLNEYISRLNPVSIKEREFDPIVKPGNWSHIFDLIIDSAILVNDYQEDNMFVYDRIIITRFDEYILQNIKELYMPETMCTLSHGDDNFYHFPGHMIDIFVETATKMKHQGTMCTHEIQKVLISKGVPCHRMYPPIVINSSYPFYRNIRHFTTKPGQFFYECSLEEILTNPESKYYGFRYKPNTEFTLAQLN